MVKLLTYNVLDGALPDRLPKVVRVLRAAGADIIAVQEARHWRRNRREAFLKVSRSLRMPGLLFRANSGFDLAVFTRLPVAAHTNYGPHTNLVHTTAAVTLTAPSGIDFTVFATHLRPDYPHRRREAARLISWMLPYRNKFCAVCGDFNSLAAGDYVASRLLRAGSPITTGSRGIIAPIEKAGWVDCFRLRNPRAPGLTLGTGRRVARVDYIFASKPLADRLVACRVLSHPDARLASDHSPVWAEFDV